MTHEPKTQPDPAVVDPTPHRDGQTTPSLDGGPSPRMPHERDESADSQASAPRDVIVQAHKDIERGLVDTDRGPVTDNVYENSVRLPDEATRDRGAAAAPGGHGVDRSSTAPVSGGAQTKTP